MSQAAPSMTSPVRGSIVPNPGQPSNLATTFQNLGSSSSCPVSSTTGGKPPAQFVSVVSRVTSSTRLTPDVEQSTVIVPPTKNK